MSIFYGFFIQAYTVTYKYYNVNLYKLHGQKDCFKELFFFKLILFKVTYGKKRKIQGTFFTMSKRKNQLIVKPRNNVLNNYIIRVIMEKNYLFD